MRGITPIELATELLLKPVFSNSGQGSVSNQAFKLLALTKDKVTQSTGLNLHYHNSTEIQVLFAHPVYFAQLIQSRINHIIQNQFGTLYLVMLLNDVMLLYTCINTA